MIRAIKSRKYCLNPHLSDEWELTGEFRLPRPNETYLGVNNEISDYQNGDIYECRAVLRGPIICFKEIPGRWILGKLGCKF